MPSVSPSHSRSEYAYQQIRRGLLAGRWRSGEALSAYSLAEELTVSRTPIMEALKRLESEGYLEIVPQVGCVVRGISSEQIRELFLIRAALEGVAAELAAARIGEPGLRRLRSNQLLAAGAAERDDAESFQELNQTFHRLIVEAAEVPLLSTLIMSFWQRREYETGSQIYFRVRMEQSLAEHGAIVVLLAARDAARARAAAEAHVRAAAEQFAQLIG